MRVLTGPNASVYEPTIKSSRILIVDDDPGNVQVLEAFLEAEEFTDLVLTSDSSRVIELCATAKPDLILLDLGMPAPDGYELLQLLGPLRRGPVRLPVLVLTGDQSPDATRRALGLGADDFLTKPFDPSEVVLRVANLLETRVLEQRLHAQNAELEQRVRERTRELDDARLEIVERLAQASEYRDDATGDHVQRVGRTVGLLGRALGLPDDTVELFRHAAQLHDIGKLGISDALLVKRGRLSEAEREVMKLHVTIGADMLAGSRSSLLRASEEVVRTHHERWDGSGYPAGLKGEEIPLEGRLTAVADVYDALTHRRPYEEPWTVERAVAEVRGLSGRHFDPRVVEAFLTLPHERLVESVSAFDPFAPERPQA